MLALPVTQEDASNAFAQQAGLARLPVRPAHLSARDRSA